MKVSLLLANLLQKMILIETLGKHNLANYTINDFEILHACSLF
jgi:hypothetical protein